MREQKPSSTACLVAAGLGMCSQDPKLVQLVNPLAAQMSADFMNAYGMPATLFTEILHKPWFRSLATTVERRMLPGLMLHYLLRKRYFEQVARQHLEQGVRQVVILGAGFDVLAVSLQTLFPQVTFLELDTPATQRAKQKALAARALSENLIFVPVDFSRQTLEEILLSHPRYQPDVKTLFMAEGVLMYLVPADIRRLFDFIRGHSGPESWLVFTFIEPRQKKVNNNLHSKIVYGLMSLWGEPFTWTIAQEELSAFVMSLGFSLEALVTPADLRERFVKPADWSHVRVLEEYMAVAKTGR